MSSRGHSQLSTRRDGFFPEPKVFILLMLYSVPALKVYSNTLELPNLNYIHGVTLELRPKDI